jgi:hypothetical protein
MAITNSWTKEVEYEGRVLAVRGRTRLDMFVDEVEVILDDGSPKTITLEGPSDFRFAKVNATDEFMEKYNSFLLEVIVHDIRKREAERRAQAGG